MKLLTTLYGSNALLHFHKPTSMSKPYLSINYNHGSDNINSNEVILLGDGNKGPPKIPTTILVDYDDNDENNDENDETNDETNDENEEFIPLNKDGVLELKDALSKLGVNPKNFIDILKQNVKLSRKHKPINIKYKEN